MPDKRCPVFFIRDKKSKLYYNPQQRPNKTFTKDPIHSLTKAGANLSISRFAKMAGFYWHPTYPAHRSEWNWPTEMPELEVVCLYVTLD